jgi:hypothetical protein
MSKVTRAQIEARIDRLHGTSPPRAKTVTVGGAVVREAQPHVSIADPNYPNSDGGVVKVSMDDIRRHNAALIYGRHRSWKVEVVDGPSSAVAADVDRAVELRRELAAAGPYRLGCGRDNG